MSQKSKILLVLGISVVLITLFRVGVNAALWIACSDQNISLIKATVKLGANTESRDNGRTPLIYAVEANEIQAVQALLEAGADPNAAYANGVTALETADGEGFAQVAKLLLKHGAVRRVRK